MPEIPSISQLILSYGAIGLLVIAGLFARKSPINHANTPKIPGWGIRPLDFALLCWLILMAWLIALPMIAGEFLRQPEEPHAQIWNILVASWMVQIPLIGFFLIAGRLPSGRQLLGLFSTLHRQPIRRVWSQATVLFLSAMPAFFLIKISWGIFVYWLTTLNLPVELSEQDSVRRLAQADHTLYFVGVAIAVVVFAPIWEEFFFRGVLYRFLRGRLVFNLAAWISGACFAVVHLNLSALFTDAPLNLSTLAPLMFLGYLLARAYEYTGDIRVPIIMHALFNLFSICMIVLMRAFL